MMIPEPSPRDTMPLAKVPAEDVLAADVPVEDVLAENLSLEDILLDGGRHRRPDEPETPLETPERRRFPVVPVAVAVVALGLVGALVYGTNHEVQGSGSADPASLPGQQGPVLPPETPTSTDPGSTSASAPPASAKVHGKATSSDVVTSTSPPPPNKPVATGGNGQGDDTAAIESSIASSIMRSLQSRFGPPPPHR